MCVELTSQQLTKLKLVKEELLRCSISPSSVIDVIRC